MLKFGKGQMIPEKTADPLKAAMLSLGWSSRSENENSDECRCLSPIRFSLDRDIERCSTATV